MRSPIASFCKPVNYKIRSMAGKLDDSEVYSRGKLKPDFEGINLLEFLRKGKGRTFEVVSVKKARY